MTEQEVYLCYMRSKAKFNNRGYREPKDIDLTLEKLRQKNQKNYDNLIKLSNWFNTKWSNINIEKYFECGFLLWKNFSYHQFFNDKVIQLYKQKDRIQKFHTEINKKELLKSFKFIKKYCKNDKISSLKEYCNLKDQNYSICINHYIQNKIDTYSLVYFILKKYLVLNVYERDKLVSVINNITQYKSFILQEWKFLEEMEKLIGN